MADSNDINELADLYLHLPRYQRWFILWQAKIMRRKSIGKIALSILLGILVGLTVYNIMQPSPVAIWAALLAGYYTSTGYAILA